MTTAAHEVAPASHQELATAIVRFQMAIIGRKAALVQAKSSTGVAISDSGEVADLSKEALAALVEAYRDVGGDVAVVLARKAIARLVRGGEDLPPALEGAA